MHQLYQKKLLPILLTSIGLASITSTQSSPTNTSLDIALYNTSTHQEEFTTPAPKEVLDIAIGDSNLSIVKKLLELGVAPSEHSLLIATSFNNQKAILEELLKHKAPISTLVLANAISADDTPLAIQLLNQDAPVSPLMLHDALINNNLPIVKKLLERGVAPSEATLSMAIFLNNQEDIIKELIKHKAPVTLDTIKYAVSKGAWNIAQILAEWPDTATSTFFADEKPLDLSFYKYRNVQHQEIVEALAQKITSGKGEFVKETLLSLIIWPELSTPLPLIEQLLHNLTTEERQDIAQAILDKFRSLDARVMIYKTKQKAWEDFFTKELTKKLE